MNFYFLSNYIQLVIGESIFHLAAQWIYVKYVGSSENAEANLELRQTFMMELHRRCSTGF